MPEYFVTRNLDYQRFGSYKVVVDQAAAYRQAIDKAAPAKEEVKSRVTDLLERCNT